MLSNINKKSFEDDGNKTKEVIFLPFVIVLMIETVVVIVVFIWHQYDLPRCCYLTSTRIAPITMETKTTEVISSPRPGQRPATYENNTK